MPELDDRDLRQAGLRDSEWMKRALHDLCQPLTTLDCLLYLNSMPSRDSDAANESAVLHEAIESAMVECARMREMVRSMQEHVSEDQHRRMWDNRQE